MSASVGGSSTEEKARVLPPVLSGEDIALVVAFGTAATPTEESLNGCVVAGTNVFMHDPHSKNSTSHWIPPKADCVVESSLSAKQFHGLFSPSDAVARAAALLILPPLNPSEKLRLLVDHDFVALADVNVTDYRDYAWAHKDVVASYRASGGPQPMDSLETTHAVIRACSPDAVPFSFVSGIADRVGFFDTEVGSMPYQQNFIAAHNAGVAVAMMIPQIFALLARD